MLPLLGVSIKRVYPSSNFSIFGPVMKSRMDLADKAQLCVSGVIGLSLDLDLKNLTTLSL